jgi:hypothetical protein
MNTKRLAAISILILPLALANAEPKLQPFHSGDKYEIERISDSTQSSGNGLTGSSHDKDTLSERVIGVRDTGVELEYDLPKNATAGDRSQNWQFPARVLKLPNGQVQLLNGPELEARVDIWLKRAKLPRSACAHWIFTWNAFRIECDPQSVIQSIAAFDLQPTDLRNGAMYRDALALEPSQLIEKSSTSGGSTFEVALIVDPDKVREAEVDSDLVVAEISRERLSRDAALIARKTEQISGTIKLTFEMDSHGLVLKRTTLTRLEVKRANGKTEARTNTEILERRFISQHQQ